VEGVRALLVTMLTWAPPDVAVLRTIGVGHNFEFRDGVQRGNKREMVPCEPMSLFVGAIHGKQGAGALPAVKGEYPSLPKDPLRWCLKPS